MFRISFNFEALMKDGAKKVRVAPKIDDWAEEQERVDSERLSREEVMTVFSEKFSGKSNKSVA